MKYMLLIYIDEKSWGPGEWEQCTAESLASCDELTAKNQLLSAAPLLPVATAVTVRVRDGECQVTKGPFAETTEQLGGYFLIDVADLDEAIAIPGRLPPAKKGTVEIRPIAEITGLPLATDEAQRAGDKVYMLICYDKEQYWTEATDQIRQAGMAEAVALTHHLADRGQYVAASPLHSISTATSVRVRNGKRKVMDGPFAETREVLGGYYLVAAHRADEVVAIAAKHPGARVGSVEIRQIYDLHSLSHALDSNAQSSARLTDPL